MFNVRFTSHALKQLKKMDKVTSALIVGWLRKNVEGSTNPRVHGKQLAADRHGQWRYRIGNYRVIAEILDAEVIVLVVEIGHRREIYR